MQKATPFLLFEGNAEKAMTYYTEVFPETEITVLEKYGEDGPGENGTVYRGAFRIKDLEVYTTDSIAKHDFSFTPSSSFFIDFSSEEEIDAAYEKLCEAGEVLMEIGNYGFSRKFGWVSDKYGVSWQLNLPL